MEPEQTPNVEKGSQFENLKKVTPLSKYLAMVLFIILPFFGGWIGYMYAPEKVIEVEKIVVKETTLKTSTIQGDVDTLQSLFQDQLNQDEEIEFLYSPNQSNHKYFKILYRSSKSNGIVVYDPTNNSFSRTGFKIDFVVGESASLDGRFISKLVDYSSPTTSVEIIDLESESTISTIKVSENETLWSGKCGYAGPTFNLEWISSSTFKYGVYELSSVDSEGCDTVFVEYRTESF